jgi:hypothetical protein
MYADEVIMMDQKGIHTMSKHCQEQAIVLWENGYKPKSVYYDIEI